MNKTATASSAPVDYEAEIDRYLAESQRNIERLRAETRSMLADINASLDKLSAA